MINDFQHHLPKVIQTIVESYQPDSILLFGSWGTEKATKNSDLDLLLIKSTTLPKHQRATPVWKALSKQRFLFPMDILVYTPEEYEEEFNTPFSFIYMIKHNFKQLYSQFDA